MKNGQVFLKNTLNLLRNNKITLIIYWKLFNNKMKKMTYRTRKKIIILINNKLLKKI